jgi:hypothetical protein
MKAKDKPPVNISNNTFTGVHWDKEATEAVNMIAEALVINAKALVNMSNLFHAQNINIETMLKVNTEE